MAGPRSRCASSFQAWLTEAFPFLSFPFLARQGKAGKAGQGKAGCKRGCLSLPLSLSAQGDAFLASCARSQAESIDQSDHSLILSFVRFPFLSFFLSLARGSPTKRSSFALRRLEETWAPKSPGRQPAPAGPQAACLVLVTSTTAESGISSSTYLLRVTKRDRTSQTRDAGKDLSTPTNPAPSRTCPPSKKLRSPSFVLRPSRVLLRQELGLRSRSGFQERCST